MDYKPYIGLLTLGLAFLSYWFYFRNIFRGKTKPHSISWLVWATLNGLVFLTQMGNGAGAGSWITGFSALSAAVVFILSLRYGEKNITKLDWYCVLGAIISLSFWYMNRYSTAALIFASCTFILGFIPTYRKSFFKPRQETAVTFALNGTKFLLAILALEKLNLHNALYPGVISAMNFSFVALLIIRRMQIKT